MTTNKTEVVAWLNDSHHEATLSAHVAEAWRDLKKEVEPLIRLSDYEALQAECEELRKDAAAALVGLPDSLPMEPYQTVDRGSPHYKAGWNACRRAMLAALEKLIAAHHEAHRKQGGRE